MSLTTGSLFSGYAGLDMAVNAYFGSRTAWFVEIDAAPSRILAHHWPEVPNHGDITTIDWAQVEPVDILTGGYPCQPFSAAGRRKGEDDERHLWPYVREAIRHLRPQYTVLENVAGHRSLGFDRVLGDLAEDGLHAQWCSVRASDVGACHRRERLFILVTPADAERGGRDGRASHPFRESFRRAAATGGGESGNRGDAIALLPSGDLMLPSAVNALLPTPNASDGTGGGQHPDKREGHSRQLIDYALTVATAWGDYEPAIRRAEAACGRPAPSPTEPNRNGNLRLSSRFAEWMMMLPEGHVTGVGLSRNEELKALGNGVVPAQAYAALCQLVPIAEAVAP